MRTCHLLICVSLILCPIKLNAATPKVDSLRTKIIVESASDLSVEETFVFDVGIDQKHDLLVRSLPLTLIDRSNRLLKLRYNINSLECDGGKDKVLQSWHWGSVFSVRDIDLEIGNRNRFFSSGRHSCTLRYKVSGLIRRESVRDALWFSALGLDNSWSVQNVQLKVVVPFGVQASQMESLGFVGKAGGFGQNFTVSSNSESELIFNVTRALQAGESLDIYIAWDSGILEAVPNYLKIGDLLRRNFSLILAIFILFCALLHSVIGPRWFKSSDIDEQSDLEHNTISPATLRYLVAGEADLRAFVSTIFNLAVAGCVKIIEHNNQLYLLKESELSEAELQSIQSIARDDQALLSALEPGHSVPLIASDRSLLELAGEYFELLKLANPLPALVAKSKSRLYWISLALVQCLFVIVVSYTKVLVIPYFILSLIAFMVCWLLAVFPAQNELKALSFSAVLLSVLIILNDLIYAQAGWIVATVMLTCFWLVLGVWFSTTYPALRIYKDKLGLVSHYSEYLGQARVASGRGDQLITVQLFERLLPHAVALGAEESWTQAFAEVLSKSAESYQTSQNATFQHYQPKWFQSASRYNFFEFVNAVILRLIDLK